MAILTIITIVSLDRIKVLGKKQQKFKLNSLIYYLKNDINKFLEVVFKEEITIITIGIALVVDQVVVFRVAAAVEEDFVAAAVDIEVVVVVVEVEIVSAALVIDNSKNKFNFFLQILFV